MASIDRSNEQRLTKLLNQPIAENSNLKKLLDESNAARFRLKKLLDEADAEKLRLTKKSNESNAEKSRLTKQLNESKAENSRLRDKINRLQPELERIRKVAHDRLKEAEHKGMENARLQNIIIEGGMGDSSPTDEKVEKAFSRLQQTIFNFVMKHCKDHDGNMELYGTLPPDARHWYMVARISDRIFDYFFDEHIKIFGFGLDLDYLLGNFERELWKHNGRICQPE